MIIMYDYYYIFKNLLMIALACEHNSFEKNTQFYNICQKVLMVKIINNIMPLIQ